VTTEILRIHMLYLLITGPNAASCAGIYSYFSWDEWNVPWTW